MAPQIARLSDIIDEPNVARLSDIVEPSSTDRVLSAANAIGKYIKGVPSHPLTSVVPRPVQKFVTETILGHDIAEPPEPPGIKETYESAKKAVREHPIAAPLGAVAGLTGVPAIWEFLKTAKETGGDIARGAMEHPLATGRGLVGGVTEGLMEAASPAQIAALVLAKKKLFPTSPAKLAARAAASAERAAAKTAARVAETPLERRVSVPRLRAGEAKPPTPSPRLAQTLQEALEEARGLREPVTRSTLPEPPGITPAGREMTAVPGEPITSGASSGRPGVTAERYEEMANRGGAASESPGATPVSPSTYKPRPLIDPGWKSPGQIWAEQVLDDMAKARGGVLPKPIAPGTGAQIDEAILARERLKYPGLTRPVPPEVDELAQIVQKEAGASTAAPGAARGATPAPTPTPEPIVPPAGSTPAGTPVSGPPKANVGIPLKKGRVSVGRSGAAIYSDEAAAKAELARRAERGVKSRIKKTPEGYRVEGVPGTPQPTVLEDGTVVRFERGKYNKPPKPTPEAGSPEEAAALKKTQEGWLRRAGNVERLTQEGEPLAGEFFQKPLERAKALERISNGEIHPKFAEIQQSVIDAMHEKGLPSGENFRKAARIIRDRVDSLAADGDLGAASDVAANGVAQLVKSNAAGFFKPEVAVHMTSTGLGALAGASGDDKTVTQRVVGAIAGGMVGELAAPVIVSMMTHGLGPQTLKAAQGSYIGGLLSSPISLLKAWGGALGGLASAMLENPTKAPKMLATFLDVPTTAKTFARSFSSTGSDAAQLAMKYGREAPSLMARAYGSMDAVARRAMMAGGVSAEDAARYTLSGMPTSALGTETLAHLSNSFISRFIFSMFPRVGIQMVERGLERTPGLGFLPGVATKSGNPIIKQILGGVALKAGYEYGDKIPAPYLPLVVAATGPYALLLTGGVLAKQRQPKGDTLFEDVAAKVQGYLNAIGQSSPLPQYGYEEVTSIGGRLAGTVPGAVRLAARVGSPHPVDTSGSTLGRFMANVPGLRERLPQKGWPVNIAGERIPGADSPLGEVLLPSGVKTDPYAGIPDDLVSELKRLHVDVTRPPFKRTIAVGKQTLDIPVAVAERAQRASRAVLVPRLNSLTRSAAYRNATESRKKGMLERAVDAATSERSQRAQQILRAGARRKRNVS